MRLITKATICVLATAAALAPALALAASSDYFLKLGPIKGEGSAARTGHQDQIEILSYGFGATRKGWDGTVKGGSIADADAAKFGAIGGMHRADGLAVVSPRDAASGLPTGKRQHKPFTIVTALDRGSVTVQGAFPGCTVGTEYASAVLQVAGARYEMTDVQITSCPGPAGAARSSMAGEYLRQSVTLNYKKVKVRGWNPETKEL